MDDTNPLPNDLNECHRLLMAAYQQSKKLEQQAAEAQSRASTSDQQVAELTHVLDETAASHEELKAAHEATIVELNRLKQWVFGRRSERIVEGEGHQHLFDLQPEMLAKAIQGASWGIPYVDERIDRDLLGVVENSVDSILDRILEGSTKERRVAAKAAKGSMFRFNGQIQTFRVEDLPSDSDENVVSVKAEA